jgi:polyhydroxybutyrate depolymerase
MQTKRLGLTAIALGCIAATAPYAAPAPNPSGTITRHELAVKGMQRTYIQYVPRNLKPNAPLLFVFHGSGGDGEGMREITGEEFDMLADTNGFVVIYPDGYQTTWTITSIRSASSPPAGRMAASSPIASR